MSRFPSNIHGVGLVALAVSAFALGTHLSLSNDYAIARLHYSDNGMPHQRRLGNVTMDAVITKTNAVGTSIRKTIKKLRGGSDELYQDVIDALIIAMCDNLVSTKTGVESPRTRFVLPNESLAYKFDNGSCVKVQLTSVTDMNVKDQYDRGMCETKPNCYWGPIETGANDRAPVYSTDETMPPPASAMTLDDAEKAVAKWWCDARNPGEAGYGCIQTLAPVVFFILFATVVIGCGGVALFHQNRPMTNAILDIFTNTATTLQDTDDWISRVQMPLEAVRDQVVESAVNVSAAINNTDFIDNGVADLIGRLVEFKMNLMGRTLPDGCTLSADDPYCVPCDLCTGIAVEVAKAQTQVEANAGVGIQKLKNVRDQLQTLLVAKAVDARNQVNAQVDKMDVFRLAIQRTRNQVEEWHQQFDQHKKQLQLGVLALFGLAIVTIGLGLVGVLLGLTPLRILANIIHVAYMIGFFALIITFLLSSIFLAVSVLMSDACEMTLIFEEDWTPMLGNEAKGFNACFRNESLIEALNLTENLQFARGGLAFPDLQVDKMLDFSALDAFGDTIKAMNISSLKLDTTALTSALSYFNQFVGANFGPCRPNETYTLDNILEPWTAHSDVAAASADVYIKKRYMACDMMCPHLPNGAPFPCKLPQDNPCTFSTFVVELYHQVSSLRLIQRDVGVLIDALHQNVTKVTDFGVEFKGNIRGLLDRIDIIKQDLSDHVIESVQAFEDTMYCTFLADDLNQIYGSLCGDLLSVLSTISLMLFLAGVFLIPVNICLIVACRRLTARNEIIDSDMATMAAMAEMAGNRHLNHVMSDK